MKTAFFVFVVFFFEHQTSFSQSRAVFFNSEITAGKEAIQRNDIENAKRHFNKAAEYAGKNDQNELLYYEFKTLWLSNDFAGAEIALKKLISSNSYQEKDFPGITDEIASFEMAALEHKKKDIILEEDKAAWVATDKNSLEGIRKYLKDYPDGVYNRDARKLMGQLAVKKQQVLDESDLKNLDHYKEESASVQVEEIYSIQADNIRSYLNYPNLLFLFVDHSTWLNGSNSSSGLSMPKFESRFVLHDIAKSKLQGINISDCRFERNKLLDKLASPNITYLRIGNCQIEELGKIRMSILRTLFLDGNRLIEMPDVDASTSRSVTSLHLGENQFNIFPIELKKFPNLKALYLRENQITKIPSDISHFKNLEILDLSFNKINNLSPKIYGLEKLKELYLFGLKTKQLPPGIQQLKNLEVLGLGGDLQALPSGIAELESLKVLYLVEMSNLISFPKEIENFKKLETLYIRKNPWRKVPDEIGKFRRLKSLYLVDFELTNVPEVVFQLRNLKNLDLSKNPITQINRVKELKFLERLDLSDCNIDSKTLMQLRCELPSATITYFDSQLEKNISSKPIEGISIIEFSEMYQYFLEGDAEIGFRLGQFFAERNDAAIAQYIFKTCANIPALEGKFKGVLNWQASAEMFERLNNQDSILKEVNFFNWSYNIEKVLNSKSYKEFCKLCNCEPRDKKSIEIILNACNKSLKTQGDVAVALQRVSREAKQIFDTNASDSQKRMTNASNWVLAGTTVTDLGLDNYSGLGTLTGEFISLFSKSNAEEKMRIAENALSQMNKISQLSQELNKEIDTLKDVRKKLDR